VNTIREEIEVYCNIREIEDKILLCRAKLEILEGKIPEMVIRRFNQIRDEGIISAIINYKQNLKIDRTKNKAVNLEKQMLKLEVELEELKQEVEI